MSVIKQIRSDPEGLQVKGLVHVAENIMASFI